MPLNAKLLIETGLWNGKTVLQNTYCTQPFKVANITEDGSLHGLQLMLMSSSPGILDGDRYDTEIRVGEGCWVSLETQSYQRLFQMKEGASQQMVVKMKKGSTFIYLPHPVVPHRHSLFKSESKVFLEEECTLLWGEVISCGRKLNGEVFQFSSFHSLTEIYRMNKLVVKENLLLKPGQMDLSAVGQLEGFSHQATLLYLNEEATITTLIEKLTGDLNEQKDITFGISALPVNGLIIRLLGFKAERLFHILKRLSLLLQSPHLLTPQTSKAYVI
jgi:urease accessory protein